MTDDETHKLPTEPKPKGKHGGARKGAGRPSVAVAMERADAAATAAVERLREAPDPEKALERVLQFHIENFEKQIARGKFGSPQKAAESARAILAVSRELLPYRTPKLSSISMQAQVDTRCVVWAPQVCSSTETLSATEVWQQRYATPPNTPELPAPHVDAIVDAVKAEQEKRQQVELEQRTRDAQLQLGVNPSAEEWSEATAALIRKWGTR